MAAHDDGQFSTALYRVFMAMQLSFHGSVCLYQGEELGLLEADIAFEDLQDPYGIEFWPEFKGRDGCRTPMVWEKDAPNGGFSIVKPWLPVAESHLAAAVDQQIDDASSILSAYKQFIAFRKQHPALIDGDIADISADGEVVHFVRDSGQQKLFCAFNIGDNKQILNIPAGVSALDGHGFTATLDGNHVTLPYGQAFIGQF